MVVVSGTVGSAPAPRDRRRRAAPLRLATIRVDQTGRSARRQTEQRQIRQRIAQFLRGVDDVRRDERVVAGRCSAALVGDSLNMTPALRIDLATADGFGPHPRPGDGRQRTTEHAVVRVVHAQGQPGLRP
jgi:hypothetical protein